MAMTENGVKQFADSVTEITSGKVKFISESVIKEVYNRLEKEYSQYTCEDSIVPASLLLDELGIGTDD